MAKFNSVYRMAKLLINVFPKGRRLVRFRVSTELLLLRANEQERRSLCVALLI